MTQEKKSIAALSVDSQVVYNRIRRADIGEIVTYKELRELVGRDIQDKSRHCLDTAIRIAQREDRIVFGSVRGVGVKRLSDLETVAASSSGVDRIRRIAKRSARKATCVDFDALPNETKIKHNAIVSLYGAIAHASKPASVVAVESAVANGEDKLPLAKTLALFGGASA